MILTIDSAGNSQSNTAPVEQPAQQTDQQAAQSSEAKEIKEAKEANASSSQAPSMAAPNQSQPTSTSAEATYTLPDLGVDTAEISEWLVKEGDTVTAEQPLVLVESDKASVEVPAPVSGKIIKFLVNAGDTVSNGQDFVVIEAAGSVQSASSSASQPQATTHTAQQAVAKTQNTASTSTSSATTTASQSSSQSKLSEAQINAKNAAVYAGPAVRKLARQLGVDISEVTGTGANGRIVKEDVFAYVKNTIKAVRTPAAANNISAPSAARSGLPNLPDMSKTEIWGEIERQDLTRLQKVSIPQLNYNTYLPQVTQFDLADITDVEKLRGDLKDEMKKEGVSLTILAFIMKVTAYALMQHPKFNSHLSDDNTQIIIRKSVNLGFAVATEDGLTVPVIQRVEQKGIKLSLIHI